MIGSEFVEYIGSGNLVGFGGTGGFSSSAGGAGVGVGLGVGSALDETVEASEKFGGGGYTINLGRTILARYFG